MCDYSLHGVANRPAKVGDKLVSTLFTNALTRGFIEAGGDKHVAVCLLPGTQLRFEQPVKRHWALSGLFGHLRDRSSAVFTKVNEDVPDKHHDALEFPGGRIFMVTHLVAGQKATVISIPGVKNVMDTTPRDTSATVGKLLADVAAGAVPVNDTDFGDGPVHEGAAQVRERT